MIVGALFLLVALVGAVARLVHRYSTRSKLRIPPTVPQEWVEEYRAGNQ